MGRGVGGKGTGAAFQFGSPRGITGSGVDRCFSLRPRGRPMPSPFPGMDPYLEGHWRDVHARLIIYASDALQGVLPGSLRARVEESVLLETPEGLGDHPLFADVRLVEYTSNGGLETCDRIGA